MTVKMNGNFYEGNTCWLNFFGNHQPFDRVFQSCNHFFDTRSGSLRIDWCFGEKNSSKGSNYVDQNFKPSKEYYNALKFRFIASETIYNLLGAFMPTGKLKNVLVFVNFCPKPHFRSAYVDQKVNRCWPNLQNMMNVLWCTHISIYSSWNGLEVVKSLSR